MSSPPTRVRKSQVALSPAVPSSAVRATAEIVNEDVTGQGGEVAETWKLVLPQTLLTDIRKVVGDVLDGRAAWRGLEDISKCYEDRSGVAAVRGETPVRHVLLRPIEALGALLMRDRPLLESCSADWGQPLAKTLADLGKTDPVLDRNVLWLGGFAGFLVTDPQFRREQAELVECWRSELIDTGVPYFISCDPEGSAPRTGSKSSDENWWPFGDAIRSFCIRWRLAGWHGPDLLEPLDLLVQWASPVLPVAPHARSHYVTIAVPITMPVDKDELAKQAEARRRTHIEAETQRGGPDFSEWDALVKAGGTDRRRNERFALMYGLSYDWRAIHRAIGDAGRRRRGVLSEAFSVYMGVSVGTIDRTLSEIGDRLGKDWADRD